MDNIFSQNIIPSVGFIMTLFGIIVVHRLVEIRNIRQSKRPYVNIFKSCFKNQIANSKGIGKFYLGDMASGFSGHEYAVREIIPILPKR